jgi:hypothetical protein
MNEQLTHDNQLKAMFVAVYPIQRTLAEVFAFHVSLWNERPEVLPDGVIHSLGSVPSLDGVPMAEL